MKLGQDVNLLNEFSRGFRFYTLDSDKFLRPYSFSLMREDGSGIKIRSFVYDVGPNLEVGSLLIEKCSQSDPKEKLIELPDNFKQATGIKILHIVEGDSNVESGIVSTSSMNEELFILPGEMPHSLHIQAPFFSDSFKSEYNLEYYKRDCS